MANRDLSHLVKASALGQMHKAKEYTTGQKSSRSLRNNLRAEQKQAIRGYLQLEAATLIKDKTILEVKLPELEPLLPKCHVVLIE